MKHSCQLSPSGVELAEGTRGWGPVGSVPQGVAGGAPVRAQNPARLPGEPPESHTGCVPEQSHGNVSHPDKEDI